MDTVLSAAMIIGIFVMVILITQDM